MKGRVSLEEFKQKKEVFLALNQALPLTYQERLSAFVTVFHIIFTHNIIPRRMLFD